ncbi:MAG: hypothetical protein BWY11_02157 [Firmicutes bacterium ADurb.Bin182]|nr:MAG: hypothetical protein BWY11_02157 [Firmicutes bacterium ADurb.Bin182]
MINEPAPKKKTGLIIGLTVGGLVLTAVVVLFFFLNKTNPVIGPWHSEELNSQIRFHEDNTVVIRTAYGDTEAEYIFDGKDGKGVITVNGSSVKFALKDDVMIVTDTFGTNEFVRGEHEIITALTESPPQITPEETPAASPSSPPAAETPAAPPATEGPKDTPSPTPAPEPTPTQEAATPAPSSSPGFIKPGDYEIIPMSPPFIPGVVLGKSVLGVWISNDDNSIYMEFFDDGTYVFGKDGNPIRESTYTYDKSTGEGVIIAILGIPISFKVEGNTLTLSGGDAYTRQ